MSASLIQAQWKGGMTILTGRLRGGRLALRFAATFALTFGATRAFGQSREADRVAVFELGPAADVGLAGEPANFGGTVAVEVTPIERWLELEAGVTALGTNGRKEVSADLLFKKPFQFSPSVEFMAGAGPELSWQLSGARHKRSVAGELVLDFMFWPTRRLGWYFEPGLSLSSLRASGDRSIGIAGGLLIGVW
jgi:hypothetical protein